MTRLLALLAAVAMVLAAVVIRDQMHRDGSKSPTERFHLVCGTELASACHALKAAHEDATGDEMKLEIEPEQSTLDRLANGDLILGDGSAWLVAGPWPEIGAAGGGVTGTTLPRLESSAVLARSPAVIVARNDRMKAVRTACHDAVDWSCIGTQAGEPWTQLGGQAGWGLIKVALPSPTAGDGMVAVNQAVASRVGRTDFATNDLDDPAVGTWFSDLASQSKANSTAIPATSSPLERFLRLPSSLGVVGALESQTVAQLGNLPIEKSEPLAVVTPEPVVTADVHLWSNKGSAKAALDSLGASNLRKSLANTGWRVAKDSVYQSPKAGHATMDTVATLPKDDGLPKPGVIAAVDSRWENI